MHTESLSKINPHIKKPFFSAAEARSLGVHPSLLAYYCKTGTLEKIGRGIYRQSGQEFNVPIEWEDLAVAVLSIPDGVVCLSTALSFYELTEEQVREFWIAVPREKFPPKRPHTRIVRMSDMKLGRREIVLGEVRIPMFDQERTIVDAFRYLSIETALFALKRYLKGEGGVKPDIKKLKKYAVAQRTDLEKYIMALSL